MPTATCHCGAVKVSVPRRPQTLTDCNCSICRRYGALWAYYKASTVRVEAARGATRGYMRGAKTLRFVRCANCGCMMYWEPTTRGKDRMGVNMRNFEPELWREIPVTPCDGASW